MWVGGGAICTHVRPLSYKSTGREEKAVVGQKVGAVSQSHHTQGIQGYEIHVFLGHYEGIFVKAGGCANDF